MITGSSGIVSEDPTRNSACIHDVIKNFRSLSKCLSEMHSREHFQCNILSLLSKRFLMLSVEGIKGGSHGTGPISEGGIQKPVNLYNMYVPQWGNVIGSIKNACTWHICVIN